MCSHPPAELQCSPTSNQHLHAPLRSHSCMRLSCPHSAYLTHQKLAPRSQHILRASKQPPCSCTLSNPRPNDSSQPNSLSTAAHMCLSRPLPPKLHQLCHHTREYHPHRVSWLPPCALRHTPCSCPPAAPSRTCCCQGVPWSLPQQGGRQPPHSRQQSAADLGQGGRGRQQQRTHTETRW